MSEELPRPWIKWTIEQTAAEFAFLTKEYAFEYIGDVEHGWDYGTFGPRFQRGSWGIEILWDTSRDRACNVWMRFLAHARFHFNQASSRDYTLESLASELKQAPLESRRVYRDRQRDKALMLAAMQARAARLREMMPEVMARFQELAPQEP